MITRRLKALLFFISAALAALLIPSSGTAMEPVEKIKTVSLHTGVLHDVINQGGAHMQRTAMSVGLSYDWTPRLTLRADLFYGVTSFGFSGKPADDLGISAEAMMRLDVSAMTTLTWRLLNEKPYWLNLHASFESSILHSDVTIEKFDVTLPQGEFDVVPYVSRNSRMAVSWYQVSVGATIGARFGPVQPNCMFGFSLAQALMEPRLSRSLRDTAGLLDYDPNVLDQTRVLQFFRALVSPGVTLSLGKSDAIAAGMRFAPDRDLDTYCYLLSFTHRF